MVETTFSAAIKELSQFFERKEPSFAAIDLWFKVVQKIPDESVPWIVEKIKGSDIFPRNLTNVFWDLYRQWLTDNPHKRAPVSSYRQECRDCNGDGYLFVRKSGQGKCVFRCQCLRAREQGIPVADVRELMSQGWV